MKSGLGFVAAVNLIIWAGITLYLFVLDRRLKKLEQRSGDRDQGTGMDVHYEK
jgi:CcmD family protein